jgi:hypothetical protein
MLSSVAQACEMLPNERMRSMARRFYATSDGVGRPAIDECTVSCCNSIVVSGEGSLQHAC